MAYPQELINEVLDYLDSGHSVREAERRFGVGHESAARLNCNPKLGRPK